MTKVFIGGSRRLSKLNKKVTQTLDRLAEKGFTVLIGDANGADKAVQNYLMNKKYSNVIIYCMQNGCRNNIGHWQTKSVEISTKSNGFQFYSTKDLKMAKDTDYGFMLWDSKSKGTLNNIVNLLKEYKQVVVYFSPSKALYTINTFSDLSKLLEKCDKNSLSKFEKDLNISQLVLQPTLWTSEEQATYKT
jgi:UDP-N-acetylmuramate-alanine ligase